MNISSSVGLRGANLKRDVTTVQQYLKNNGYPWLVVDGLLGINTVKAIKMYQSHYMTHPDGRIDVGGATFRHMTTAAQTRNMPPVNAPHPEWNRADFSGRLTVQSGQVTFDAEGNDNQHSPFFSRHIHWPGGVSGVTIGRGYDMGGRSANAIITDLVRAGVEQEQAMLLAASHGKTGHAARVFVTQYRHACGIISREAQARLFELIYPSYVTRARRIYNGYAANVAQAVAWEQLHKSIQEIAVDLVYQGLGYRSFLEPCMSNNVDTLIDFIETEARVSKYENGRQRANYLRRNRV